MTLIKFINQLNNSIEHNKILEIYYNRKVLKILKILKDNNYLKYSTSFKSENKIFINIKKVRFKKLKLISKPSRSLSISYKKLMDLDYDCILSTSLGILDKEEAIRLKRGGIILFKIDPIYW